MRLRALLSCSVLSLVVACGDAPTAVGPTARAGTPLLQPASYTLGKHNVAQLLVAGGRFAESSYMACLMSYFAQGLPFKQAYELCATELTKQGETGWGLDGGGIPLPNEGEPFDASTITTSCGGGDGRYASGARPMTVVNPYDGKTKDDFGAYSWGGKGLCAADGCSRGLSEAQSKELKGKAVLEYYQAEGEYREAAEALLKDPENPVKKANEEAARKEMEAKRKEAEKDPNFKPKKEPAPQPPPQPAPKPAPSPNVSEGASDEAACALVLQQARETLAECHRTGWKTTTCQQLHAKMNRCPDPTLIYVDPESGYACAPKVDPQLVIDAWTRECEKRVTPGPDGGSPCHKPDPSESGATVQGDESDICRSPIALTDPEQSGCIRVLEVDDFGQRDIGDLIVWGQGVFGGPIVVLPLPAPRPPFPPKS